MSAAFDRIAVIGLGLLGGSLAAAARERGLARRVVGASRSREAREFALANGWVDECGTAVEAARGADLVVLATPVFAMAGVLEQIAPVLAPGTLVSDVGSVKATLAETLPGLLPAGVLYVGSHPMAGSHERGVESARADLFEGAACVVTEGPDEARERLAAFWQALGSRVVRRSAAEHDEQVAWTSHLPHAAAFAFAAAFGDAPGGAREVVGSGFRDFTRIANSDPELWADILTSNRKALAAPLNAAVAALVALGRAIESDDTDVVEHWITRAREALAASHHDPTTRPTDDVHRQGNPPEPPDAAPIPSAATPGVRERKTNA